MSLERLEVQDFRNLARVHLDASPHLNIIYGENASGKTSLLETIHVLGRAKSFRTPKIRPLIRHGTDHLTVFGVSRSETGDAVPIGVERGLGKMRIRVSGADVRNVSELVGKLPLQLITPESHQLLEHGPRFRRRFLDWGVFHVEHEFYPAWHRFQRALRQRNAALRSRAVPASRRGWEQELVEWGEVLHRLRSRYVEALQPVFQEYVARLTEIRNISFRYLPGWPESLEYSEALSSGVQADLAVGYTRAGPHRADIALECDGVSVPQVVSRGQQKLLVAAMVMAQATVFSRCSGRRCVILVDDLPAELDARHRATFLAVLSELHAQAFVTAIDPDMVDGSAWAGGRWFHVEQGEVKAR